MLRQQTTAGKRMKGVRQGTVEPVFGSLIQYYGLNKIPVLGIDVAHKTMLTAAIAFNIRKYMKWHPNKAAEDALQKPKITSQSNWKGSPVTLVQDLIFRSDDRSRNERKKFDWQLCNNHGRLMILNFNGDRHSIL